MWIGIAEGNHALLNSLCSRRKPFDPTVYIDLPDDVRASCLFARSKTPDEISIERPGNLLSQPCARETAIDPSGDLTDQMSIGVRVIDVPSSRFPPWISRGDGTAHGAPVPKRIVGQRLTDRRNARAVAEDVSDSSALLASEELGPPSSRSGVEIDPAALDELQQPQRNDRLPHRVRVHHRVVGPLASVISVRPSSPDVDDHPPIYGDAACSADFALLEVDSEGFPHRAKRRITGTPDHDLTVREAGTVYLARIVVAFDRRLPAPAPGSAPPTAGRVAPRSAVLLGLEWPERRCSGRPLWTSARAAGNAGGDGRFPGALAVVAGRVDS